MALYLILILAFVSAPLASCSYSLKRNYGHSSFFDGFDFFTGTDPTHGFVDYVDEDTAKSLGLAKVVNQTVYIGVEHVSQAVTPGRKSVRLESKEEYKMNELIVFDLEHMPGEACGSWPAFWTVGDDWPADGEIDIIEGANKQTYNQMTLHTATNCKVDDVGFSGTLVTSDCYVDANGQAANAGCGIKAGLASSFGARFNANGGGVYAMEWTTDHISVWFFSRDQIPSEITTENTLDPSGWGVPTARFRGDCNIPAKFGEQRIVLNIAFCGDYAGGTWSESACASYQETCENYVAAQPEAFQGEYWQIRSLKIYSAQGGLRTLKTSSSTPSLSASRCAATHLRRKP